MIEFNLELKKNLFIHYFQTCNTKFVIGQTLGQIPYHLIFYRLPYQRSLLRFISFLNWFSIRAHTNEGVWPLSKPPKHLWENISQLRFLCHQRVTLLPLDRVFLGKERCFSVHLSGTKSVSEFSFLDTAPQRKQKSLEFL